jgi:hypothetical protein
MTIKAAGRSPAYTFLYTAKEWKAKHTYLLDTKQANKEFSQAIQTLKRTADKDFKYTAVREFSYSKTNKEWRYGFHVKVNKPVNLTKIQQHNGQKRHTGELKKVTEPTGAPSAVGPGPPGTENFFNYESKDFKFTLSQKIQPFTSSHNVN